MTMWTFPTQLPSINIAGVDCDPIRATGENLTGMTLVQVRVPPQIAREVATRWLGSVGFAEVTVKQARIWVVEPCLG
jgi:hypothetical protein